MNYCGYTNCDAANGPGMRVSVFVSGCTLHCNGCFNPESWDFKAGKVFDEAMLAKVLKDCEHPFVSGLSVLGGDPFEAENMDGVLALLKAFRAKFGDTRTVWIWSGRTYEKLMKDTKAAQIIALSDVLVDGPYIESRRVTEQGQWFGSTNQRVLNIKSL